MKNLTMHLETLEKRRNKIFKQVNVGQSVCEFYSYGTPPDYIFYIGEALGEAASMIPLRTGIPELAISREQRWEEIRAMFHWHAVILDLMEVDVMKIKDEQFSALELLKTERQ